MSSSPDGAESNTSEDTEGVEDAMTSADESTGGPASFGLLAIAFLVLAGGAVYFFGAVLSADDETEEAQARAEEQIELFDPTEFTSEFGNDQIDDLAEPDDEPPSSLPLAPDETGSVPSELEEPSATTVTPSPSIDPSQIALAFINRVPGDEYGRVGYIDPEGQRHITELECSRLDLNEQIGICLSATAGLGGSGRGLLLDPDLNPRLRFSVNLPSRAAVSPDGSVVAWTGFSLGHSYLDSGEFATTTQLISVDRSIGANLEQVFASYRDGERITNLEANYWGVTFVDSDLFYATLGVDDGTSIVEGRVSNSRLDVVFENATCPEVSPDGTTIVAKEWREDRFQVVAIDIETGARRDLGESRSVEDQVEWADDDTILYALPNDAEGTEAQPVYDVWALDIAADAVPRMIIPFADSPAA